LSAGVRCSAKANVHARGRVRVEMIIRNTVFFFIILFPRKFTENRGINTVINTWLSINTFKLQKNQTP